MFNKFFHILKNNNINNLKIWLIKNKLSRKVIFIPIPKDPSPTPILDSWSLLSLKPSNTCKSALSSSASCASLSGNLSDSMGTPYNKLPFH